MKTTLSAQKEVRYLKDYAKLMNDYLLTEKFIRVVNNRISKLKQLDTVSVESQINFYRRLRTKISYYAISEHLTNRINKLKTY